jgi:signal transduction histidine kinase
MIHSKSIFSFDKSANRKVENVKCNYDNIDIPIWIEDASSLKQKIDSLNTNDKNNFEQFLLKNLQLLPQYIDLVEIVDVNNATVKLFEADSKEDFLVGIRKLFDKDFYNHFQTMLINFVSGATSYSFESTKLTKKQKEIVTKVTVSIPENATNNWSSWIVTENDITQNKYYEAKLIEEKELAEKTASAKDKLFSIIAHDLKNPFNNILGFSSLLLSNIESYDTNKIKKYVEQINQSATSSYNLLSNLLNWAQLQQFEMNVKIEPIILNEIIDVNISLLKTSISKKNIILSKKLKEIVIVESDKNMLDFVIRNILSNAIKFSNFGGKIEIEVEKSAKIFQIAISDNGIGIPKSELKTLFTVGTVSRTGTENEKGTGFGLILCNEFISKLNGVIDVESTENVGTSFIVTLPYKH